MTVENSRRPIQPDGTIRLLGQLGADPQADIRCSHGDGSPAIAVYVTPQGCAARPQDRIQALCLQHIDTDGVSYGSRPILDLTVDNAWSQDAAIETPLTLGYTPRDLSRFLLNLIAEGTEVI